MCIFFFLVKFFLLFFFDLPRMKIEKIEDKRECKNENKEL